LHYSAGSVNIRGMNPFINFKTRDWIIWIGSLIVVVLSNVIPGDIDIVKFVAALIGVTSLIFAAKGNVWSEILMVVFSILYAIISWRMRYFSEMITYLGMTGPMSLIGAISWLKNPSDDNAGEVKIQKLNVKQWSILSILMVVTTVMFYYIMKLLNTPSLMVSTLSIATSFMAAGLAILRSSYFGLFYSMNDLVLIILWTIAVIESPSYIPVLVNFIIFFINDVYGFVSWKRREAFTEEIEKSDNSWYD